MVHKNVFKTRKWYGLALIAGLLLFQTACATASKQPAAHQESASAVAHEEKHWGYTGDVGPEYWYTLDPAYAIAKDGKAQSPINIVTGDLVPNDALQKPVLHYHETKFEVENNGHTIECLPIQDAENYITIDDQQYILQQFHFHAPSEHQIDGVYADMEVHLVHKDAQGNLAVVGILIREGQENALLEELFTKLPKEVTSEETLVHLEGLIDLSGLFTGNETMYRYDGSLTTPPCSEGVKWSVAGQSIELSTAQITAFKTLYTGNNRPVQNLYDRKVVLAGE
ncbi:MAG: carbonic anhydrase family protein [Treponema sp.]|jgi:carbonic anhydrase|nr:carbonic anhydrase family protein [Treponema sp.]